MPFATSALPAMLWFSTSRPEQALWPALLFDVATLESSA
jgi:hypothetical protein